MPVYEYADSILVSTLPLAELRTGKRSRTGYFDYAFDLRSSPPEAIGNEWILRWGSGASAAFFLAKSAAGFLLEFPGLAAFFIGADGDQVNAWLGPRTSEETLRHLLLDQVMPRVLAHRGRLALHAGAVRVNGTAITFLGATGSGKSTLTASFRVAGHPSLSDDALVLNPTERGVKVLPAYPSLRLWPEAVAGLYAEPPPLAAMAHYSTKRRIALSEDEAVSQPLPLAALYVLAPTTEAGDSMIGLTRLSPRDACMAMIENSFQLDVTDSRRVAGLLAEVAKVAQRVPAFRLTYPRNFELLPSVRAAVLGQRELWADTGMRSHSG